MFLHQKMACTIDVVLSELGKIKKKMIFLIFLFVAICLYMTSQREN